jgi:hypothetical protein
LKRTRLLPKLEEEHPYHYNDERLHQFIVAFDWFP